MRSLGTYSVIPLCLANLAITGCGYTSEPAVRLEIQRVEVPVPVDCINAADIPAVVKSMDEEYGAGWKERMSAPQIADALAAKVLELRGSDREFRALVSGCTR